MTEIKKESDMNASTWKWYVTYDNAYVISGPYDTQDAAIGWLEQQKLDYPDKGNDWENHTIEQLDDVTAKAWLESEQPNDPA